jgi:choline kinase|tara:strand:+ start:5825 stop:6565 length:741 start_codon:yes stop_codon:yes gene_type:complete
MQLIILASGKGSRLGVSRASSKLFLEIYPGKTIYNIISKIFNLFSSIIIVFGYKFQINKKKIENLKKIKIVQNKNFSKTNMVESLFLTKKRINSEVVIIYSDIIFDLAIIKSMLKINSSIIPLNKGWLKIWKKRMNNKDIKKDAEDLTLKKGYLTSIGKKIQKRLPSSQFMGIIKLTLGDYNKLYKFYKNLNNKKIQFTHFLDKALEKKIIKLKYKHYNKLWAEIDTTKDLQVAQNLFKNELSNTN